MDPLLFIVMAVCSYFLLDKTVAFVSIFLRRKAVNGTDPALKNWKIQNRIATFLDARFLFSMQAAHSLAAHILTHQAEDDTPMSRATASAGKMKVVVFTATGDQGASTCKYLLEDGGFEVVGITRNPESEKAKGESIGSLTLPYAEVTNLALAKMGVQLAKGDMEDVSSYAPHLKGAQGAFVNADCESFQDLFLPSPVSLIRFAFSLGEILLQRVRCGRCSEVRG